ncbi:unnamed protein product [Colias eurytheme]|nr:unnamed protein product [Colias eurytheme]
MKNQLKQMGEDISEKFVITKVLMSLPDYYKHFVSAWESAPDNKQTYDNLVARLLIEEERLKDRKESPVQSASSEAFIVRGFDKKDIKCYKCNNKGHFQSECRNKQNNKSENYNKRGKKCFYCKKVGHLKSECWFRKNKDKSDNNNAFVTQSASGLFQKAQWIVDTGASNHMCYDRELFTTYTPSTSDTFVTVGNGNLCSVHGSGQIVLQVNNGEKWIDTTIDCVLFVPELKTNLLSVKCVTDRGYVMVTNENTCKFLKQNKVCAVSYRNQDMYLLEVRYKHVTANVAMVQSSLNEWHEKLAHQNIQHVKKVLAQNNIKASDNFVDNCKGCLEGKSHRLPFAISKTTTSRVCELIHADVCGPMEEASIGGAKYFLLLKDDFSNYRTVYFLKGKYEVKAYVEKFIKICENMTGNKILYFRSDNGLEFINKDMKEMFAQFGIVHQTTVTYTPEQNGKAERENRTLVETARSLLYAKGLPKKLWAEAINTGCFVLNRTGLSTNKVKTPYEVWTGKSYNIHDLKIFGNPVFVHIPKEKRTKWDSKGENGIMVGYGEDTKGYRIFFEKNNTVQIKRDVIFLKCSKEIDYNIVLNDEQEKGEMPSQNVELQLPEEESSASSSEDCDDDSVYEPATSEDCTDDDAEVSEPQRREPSQRKKKRTSFYRCNNVVLLNGDEPRTYQEAMRHENASEWQKAMQTELNTLAENRTWEFCQKPNDCKVISSKWVFKIKYINGVKHYKARLVARGFEQNNDIDYNDIYAPVAKLTTFRLFVSVATLLKLPIHQMDVTGAFLYGEIKDNVYLQLPEGAFNSNNNVVKLHKSLYGLKQSPKHWNDKFNSVMIQENFVKSKADSCLYVKSNDKCKIYVLLYVDDILTFGTDETSVNEFKSMLCKKFRMKTLGLISDFIGINVKQNLETGVTELSQKEYLLNVLKRFHMENCKPVSSPIDQNFVFSQNCNEKSDKGYCDANWGGDLVDRKSTTGFCFMFNNCLVSWCSKKQCSVSLSSTESEYISMSMAADNQKKVKV